jgi:hypothetical protein
MLLGTWTIVVHPTRARAVVDRGFPASHGDPLLDAHDERRTAQLIFDLSPHFSIVDMRTSFYRLLGCL